ncbi:hypothetical protein CISIN_1g036857mg, partial [Citrus sinensis]
MMLHMINNNRPSYWNSNKFEHPATSNTIATDFDMNKALVDDYWGPYTGKSSLIAAMADLDLKEFQSNSRSILVIEDAVTSFESNAYNSVALSALLKFVDGLWSSSGDGRILVMTTDYKDHIDPVPLRPSCMDMHFHLSSHTFRHYLFEKIEERLAKIQATPAEVPGELMK